MSSGGTIAKLASLPPMVFGTIPDVVRLPSRNLAFSFAGIPGVSSK